MKNQTSNQTGIEKNFNVKTVDCAKQEQIESPYDNYMKMYNRARNNR